MSKILIVEDDRKLANELKTFLEKNGFTSDILTDFENTVENILKSKSDLVLLDINLPYTDGEFVCKEIRKNSDVPIIMITSKNNEIDELICLNYGADQFVTKPFNIQILLAKINGLLKRSKIADVHQNKITLNEFVLNTMQSTIEKGDIKIELTKNEYKILYFLVQNKGRIVSREEIIDYLWESESFVDDNTLTVNISRLKNKLEQVGLNDVIQTRRGQGYILLI